jgi:hypothetical protein
VVSNVLNVMSYITQYVSIMCMDEPSDAMVNDLCVIYFPVCWDEPIIEGRTRSSEVYYSLICRDEPHN